MVNFCSLCQLDLPVFPIIDEEKKFCCTGCHAVYRILDSKNLVENYHESSLFQEALKAGLISNPQLLQQIKNQKSTADHKDIQKLYLEIKEMWCPSCAEVIQLILLKQKGIFNCTVDYATDLASIEFSPRYISKDKIAEIISSLGYEPLSLEDVNNKKIGLNLYIRFGLAAFCALNAMMFSYPLYATYFDHTAHQDGRIFAWLTFFSSLPVITYCMWPIVKRFASSLRFGLLGMEALVVTGVTAAFGFSLNQLMHDSNQVYFDSMSVIITFVLLGKILEAKAKFSAKESWIRLSQSLPRRCRKYFPDSSPAFVPIKEIVVGDLVVAYAGERIALDGIVVEGGGTCNESHMTGESLPVSKEKGSILLGGSILQYGSLTFQVTGTLGESSLHRIIQAVEQNLGHKSSYVRAADLITRWFTPLVFFIAAITWLFSWLSGDSAAFLRAISVLLIACPCAIGIAAPLAESHILYRLAMLGVIIRNRGCLSLLPQLNVFIFDKTGTVTEGSFQLIDGLQNLSEKEKRILKAISQPSNHLICRAIFASVEAQPFKLDHIEEYPGRGMKGLLADQQFLLGSEQFLREQRIKVNALSINQKFDSNPISTVYYIAEEKIHQLQLGDRTRAEVSVVLKEIKQETILLSGDSHATVQAVALKCGFSQYFSEMNPLQKREFVDALRREGKMVCMIGDGINDSPALTAAQVGISVVSASDISIQVSDILLTTENLRVIPQMLRIATEGQRILKQNMFWAFFYNAIGIGLAVAGLLSPIFAAFAMTASSLIVLLNSKRIR